MKTAPPAANPAAFRRYRLRLILAIMLVSASVTALGLYLAGRHALAAAAHELLAEFRATLEASNAARDVRAKYLAHRCQQLVDNSRIHAAFEDDALDLLYLSARDELADLMRNETRTGERNPGVRARFYRFLDSHGAVIPANDPAAGEVAPDVVARLGLPRLPAQSVSGLLPSGPNGTAGAALEEIVTTPIVSSESGQSIAALVVGLPMEVPAPAGTLAIWRGLWTDGSVALPGASPRSRAALADQLPALLRAGARDIPQPLTLDGRNYLLLAQRLNPYSAYPPAWELFLYPLATAEARERIVRRQVIEGGALLLLAGLVVSHFVAVRLSRPVEKLALDSEANAEQRVKAEAALELTQAELERSARFAANASHQLKTPVAVMRAGLDELLARDDLPPGIRGEVEGLISETTRFTHMIEDLLLLSRMDAGRLRIQFAEMDLMHALAGCLDDFSVLPDPFALTIVTHGPEQLAIAGERRYLAHILQNLIENARNYNRPGGRIEITARRDGDDAALLIGNTGRSIPPEQQSLIFDRYLRGASVQELPGHGLGLNLARELARLHRGELRLRESRPDWTEFELRLPLRIATAATVATP